MLLVSQRESVRGPPPQITNTNCRYKSSIGSGSFVNDLDKDDPAHHCAVEVGHIASKINLASLLKFGIVQIC